MLQLLRRDVLDVWSYILHELLCRNVPRSHYGSKLRRLPIRIVLGLRGECVFQLLAGIVSGEQWILELLDVRCRLVLRQWCFCLHQLRVRHVPRQQRVIELPDMPGRYLLFSRVHRMLVLLCRHLRGNIGYIGLHQLFNGDIRCIRGERVHELRARHIPG